MQHVLVQVEDAGSLCYRNALIRPCALLGHRYTVATSEVTLRVTEAA
jgi:hypothetical protein